MLKDFHSDLANAKIAEKIVRDTLASLTTDYTFEDVSDDPQFYYKGDIRAVGDNKELYIEVKDDSRIADTGNILCEEEVYYKDDDRFAKGNMYCDSDYYCVVSQQERKIYVLDFKILKTIYRKYSEDFKIIKHSEQDTYAYLLPICRAKQFGALLYKLNY